MLGECDQLVELCIPKCAIVFFVCVLFAATLCSFLLPCRFFISCLEILDWYVSMLLLVLSVCLFLLVTFRRCRVFLLGVK